MKMGKSISFQITRITGGVLFAVIAVMMFFLMYQESNLTYDRTHESARELATAIRHSIEFAMAEGVPNVQPFVEKSKDIPGIANLRITPTNLIRDNAESDLDEHEKKVLTNKQAIHFEEDFKGAPVFRVIEPILSNETCISCHESKTGDPLAITSIRYSLAETNSSILSHQLQAAGMTILMVIILVFLINRFMQKRILSDLDVAVTSLKTLSLGDTSVPVACNRDDEIGELMESVEKLRVGIRSHTDMAIGIAMGDIRGNAELLSEKDELGKGMIAVRENLQKLVTATRHLNKASLDGDLSVRAEYSGLDGEYKEIVKGMNDTMTAIASPLGEGVKVLSLMQSGDLRTLVTGEYSGDYQRFKDGINKVCLSLTSLVEELTHAIETTSTAGEEISGNAMRISEATQHLAAESNGISAALDEMVQMVTENSRFTNDAAEAAQQSKHKAEQGGKVVQKTSEGMNRIAEVVNDAADTVFALGQSSDKIGEIIQVIDDIADQTNLLALNAAIEAARAGEQGRGFAVVADEVRKLAERTSRATKEIADMIKKIQHDTGIAVNSIRRGTEEVENGKKLASQAGDVLAEIVQNSGEVTRVIEKVAQAGERQAQNAEAVSESINSIRIITSDTSNGVSQLASLSANLAHLTKNLDDLISQFKISEQGQRGVMLGTQRKRLN